MAIRAINIQWARNVLDYDDIIFDCTKIKNCFRKKVKSGHSDKGGTLDIAELCLARDFLLSNSQQKCQFCSEPALVQKKMCRMHLFF